MRISARVAVILLFVVSFLATAQTIRPPNTYGIFPAGTTFWANERGSTIRVENGGGGKLIGRFTTAVGCGAHVARPLVGFYNTNSVGFVVDFGPQCPSTTSWNGTFWAGTPNRLKTLWYLSSGGVPAWNSTNAGADTFTQIALAQAPAELK
jgi:hypothetical protein